MNHCTMCGRFYVPRQSNHRFCSPACRARHHRSREAREEREPDSDHGHQWDIDWPDAGPLYRWRCVGCGETLPPGAETERFLTDCAERAA